MEDVIRKMSDTAPRDSRQPGCPEWCYQTLNLLAMGWQSYELNVERLTDYYESICVFKAWEKIPVGKPYGSKEALLKAELGIDDEDFYKALAKKVTANKIRDARKDLHTELVEDRGMSYREAAKVTNSSVSTVHSDVCSKNSGIHKKSNTKDNRKRTQFVIRTSTKPTTAAQKIRATFGDDFANQLAEALTHEI